MHTEPRTPMQLLSEAVHSSGFLGHDDAIRLALIAVLAEGHMLFEDVPGVGKTRLAKTLSGALGLKQARIQFTPDLLPSDITGLSIYNQRSDVFEFKPGPIFAQLVLCDEINRGTPKAQSALLEAMGEHQVTADGQTYHLEEPFLVMATQNPVEYEGTFALPEAQRDRFLVTARLGYPERRDELRLALSARLRYGATAQVFRAEDLLELRRQAQQLPVIEDVAKYALALVEATRDDERILLGLSPRATIALVATARANAFLNGKDYTTPDDVKYLFPAVARHRLVLRPGAAMRGATAEGVIAALLQRVSVPGTLTAVGRR
jgi:MoxR-like ATPase